MLNKKGGMIYDIFCRILTMFCLSFGFAMFRAKTMTDVWAMHKAMLFIDRPFTVDMTYRNMEYGILLFICFTASYIFSKRNLEYMQEKGGMKLVITNTVAILLILFFGITEAQGFLYFDF